MSVLSGDYPQYGFHLPSIMFLANDVTKGRAYCVRVPLRARAVLSETMDHCR